MNKKASMQLSINMIVILIIAVVILGLALGFTQKIFGQLTTSIEEQAANEKEPPMATGSEPLTMSRGSSIVASMGEEFAVKWSVYCDKDPKCSQVSIGLGSCSELALVEVGKKDITFNTADTITTILKVSSTASKGLHTCTIKSDGVAPLASGDLDIIVNIK